MIIDPGFDRKVEAQMILEEILQSGLNIRYIVNTHGHIDHIIGNGVFKATGALILIHQLDAPRLVGIYDGKRAEFNSISPPVADRVLYDGEIIKVGNLNFKVIHTPGHSKGSICLLGEDLVFTGDTLFEGAIGHTFNNDASFKELIKSIEEKLIKLPNHLKIYPGHGDASTIGEEKRSNPYLREDLGQTPSVRLRKIEDTLSSMNIRNIITPIDEKKQTCYLNEQVEEVKGQLEGLRKGVRIMAVVDEEMLLLGIITSNDLIRARQWEKTIGSIMDRNTRAVFIDDKANLVWETLKYHRSVPVVDRSYVIKGFVNRKTVLNLF